MRSAIFGLSHALATFLPMFLLVEIAANRFVINRTGSRNHRVYFSCHLSLMAVVWHTMRALSPRATTMLALCFLNVAVAGTIAVTPHDWVSHTIGRMSCWARLLLFTN